MIEHNFRNSLATLSYEIQAVLHTLEGLNERIVCDTYDLDTDDIQTVLSETGTPAGWYPRIMGYDALPTLPTNHDLPSQPQDLLDYLAIHEHISPGDKELARIKANLRMLYEAGPGAKNVDQEEDTDEPTEDNRSIEEETVSGVCRSYGCDRQAFSGAGGAVRRRQRCRGHAYAAGRGWV